LERSAREEWARSREKASLTRERRLIASPGEATDYPAAVCEACSQFSSFDLIHRLRTGSPSASILMWKGLGPGCTISIYMPTKEQMDERARMLAERASLVHD
jgi:hypothetical protein